MENATGSNDSAAVNDVNVVVEECVLPKRQDQESGAKQSVGPPRESEKAAKRRISTARGHLKVLIASWNVGNAMPPKASALIGQWIPEGGGDCDVIAVGLQESSYREKTNSVGDVTPGDRKSTAGSVKGEESDSEDAADASDGEGNDANGAEGDDAPPSPTLTVSASVLPTSTKKSSVVPDEQIHGIDADGVAAKTEATPSETEVIVKRSRAKTSMRKVSSMVKQLSSNIRDTVGDALEYPFVRQLLAHVGESYELVGKVELMEMRLFVMVHTRNAVGDVDKIAVPTGLGSVIGNKGGLVFKCVVENTSLCFASCHLAAHQEQKFLDKRNSDCAAILGSNFGRKNVSFDFQYDHCFWFGDLNYRIDMNYTAPRERTHEQHVSEVLALVKARKWTALNRNDQLRHQVEERKALAGWELPPAQFAPTFKRVRHAESEFNPQRVPSYCDRVLYKSLPGLRPNLKLSRFASVETIGTSDHKPVVAEFQLSRTPIVRVDPCLANSTAASVELTDVVATDLLAMDLGGTSDPYIKFYSVPDNALQLEPSGGHPSTAKLPSTLSPAWKNAQIPKLHVLCDAEKDVKHVHLIFLFMDYDATSKDDVMGVAVLSLDKFCSSRPRFQEFDALVTCNGKAAGSVSGKLRVTLPHQLDQSADMGVEQKISIAGCHCNVC